MRAHLSAVAGLLLFATIAAPVSAQAPVVAPVNGRIEQHEGLRILHVHGTPAERGYAHGFLLGHEIAAVAIAEFTARFARQQPLLQQVRGAFERLIDYPDDVRAEIEAVWAGLCASGADLDMPELERRFDLQDLRIANALDVFGLLGCSSFTVSGDGVEGGGVLTARNFDWPLTGPHLLDATILLVEHLPDGRATAAVTWPGYVGAVTGINRDGVAAFLHVGSAAVTFTPEPDSWPSAIALRALLTGARADGGAATFDLAQELLGNTSPPAGYLMHVVLPRAPIDQGPARVFETDRDSCVRGDSPGSVCVVTNHFQKRTDGRDASNDSLRRQQRVRAGIDQCQTSADHKVSIAEAWDLLAAVERGGGHAFGTLHSLVFRHEPWYFELRVGAMDGRQVVAAPASARRHVLSRAQVFGDETR